MAITKSAPSSTPDIVYNSDGFLRSLDRKKGWIVTEDFVASAIAGTHSFQLRGNSGVGATNPTPTGDNVQGTTFIGVDATDEYRGLDIMTSKYRPSLGVTHFECYARLSALFTAVEIGKVYIGLIHAAASSTAGPVNGVWFEFDFTGNGAFWSCNTISAAGSATEYVADGGSGRTTAAVTAGTDDYHRFSIICDPTGSDASFYFDGTLLTSIATNIPVANELCTPGIQIQKETSAAATTESLYVDYITFGMIYDEPHT